MGGGPRGYLVDTGGRTLRLGTLALVLLSGCGSGLTAIAPGDTSADADTDADSDSDADADTDADLERLQITGVQPASGSNAGGYQVTISGGPFDGSASAVFVGDTESVTATVVSVADDSLVVEVPATANIGEAAVRVVTDTHAGNRPSSFTFFEDGAGRYGVVGGIEVFHQVGTYWSTAAHDTADAFMFFVAPQAAGYAEMYFAPSRSGDGTCALDYGGGSTWTDATYFLPGTPDLRIASGAGAPLAIDQSTDAQYPWFYGSTLRPDAVTLGADWNLVLVNGDGDLPRFHVDGIAHTPDAFVLTSPDMTGDVPPSVRKAIQLNWIPGTEPNRYVVATLYRYDVDTQAVADTVTCAMRDDGQFTVPGTLWTDWVEGAQISIIVGRVVETDATLSYNNARSGMVGATFVYGAAWAVP